MTPPLVTPPEDSEDFRRMGYDWADVKLLRDLADKATVSKSPVRPDPRQLRRIAAGVAIALRVTPPRRLGMTPVAASGDAHGP